MSPNAEFAGEDRLVLSLDGKPHCSFARMLRTDVANAYPQHERAALSGWRGDLALPDGYEKGSRVDVAIASHLGAGRRAQLFSDSFEIAEKPLAPRFRPRAYELSEVLDDPGSGPPAFSILGTPHFHPDGVVPIVRLSEPGPTHPYGPSARNLIAETSGLVLDFGAGIKPDDELHERVVNLDAVHFRHVDVVSTHPRLPFRDEVFDGVVSQAVFEHLPDPFSAAREIRRVLRPGGRALIETAFMQPYHGDPDHYFNMTRDGLRSLMDGFQIEESGIQPYQAPSFGLTMQLEAALPVMAGGPWRERLSDLLEALRADGAALDAALGPAGNEILAAGWYVLARKR